MNKVQAEKHLTNWLTEPLPSISKQKRYAYRPTLAETKKTWRVINVTCFNNELKPPVFSFHHRTWWWAMCVTNIGDPKDLKSKSNCKIQLSDKWFCKQWFIDTLAHEMVHQYQWDVDGVKRMKNGLEPLLSHGPSFFKHRDRLAQNGIYLKIAHRTLRWFKYQSLKKC